MFKTKYEDPKQKINLYVNGKSKNGRRSEF